jgi:hypothetical protein
MQDLYKRWQYTQAHIPPCTDVFTLFCEHSDTQKQDRQSTYNVTLKNVRVTSPAMQKQQVLHILCVFVALVILRAVRRLRTVMSPVVCPALQYFST